MLTSELPTWEEASKIINEAERDLGRLTRGQRTDLLADNIPRASLAVLKGVMLACEARGLIEKPATYYSCPFCLDTGMDEEGPCHCSAGAKWKGADS